MSSSLSAVSNHACGMTVDDDEKRHIFIVSAIEGNRSRVEIYSVSEDTWQRGPDMPGRIRGTRTIQLEDTFQVGKASLHKTLS